MFFNNKGTNGKKVTSYKKLILNISKWLQEQGYKVKEEFAVDNLRYVDLFGCKDDEIILIEVKPNGFILDQSDLLELYGYALKLKSTKKYKNKKIKKCIVSSGKLKPYATDLAGALKIDIINSNRFIEIKNGIQHCIRV